MKPYKYTLIISQHSYSRHAFIVEHEERFVEQAKAFLDELEPYKRADDFKGPIHYGDLKNPWTSEKTMKRRYNVNDYGDVYFIHAESLSPLITEACQYSVESERERILYLNDDFDDSREIRSNIVHIRHDKQVVKELVERHFHLL